MNERSVRILLGISTFGLGVLGGAVVERWNEPPRAAMLEDMERTIRAYEARVRSSERDGLIEAPSLSRPPLMLFTPAS